MYKNFDDEKIYKELYYHEIDLKDKISNRTNFAFGINSFILGAIVFIYNKSIEYFSLEMPGKMMLIILIFLSITFLTSVFFILKSYYGYSYDYVPPANNIHNNEEHFNEYYDNYKDYFQKNGVSKKEVVDDGKMKNIISIYRNSANKNRMENIRKSKWLRWYSWSLILILFFVVLNIGMIAYFDFSTVINENDNSILKGGEIMASKNDINNSDTPEKPPEPPNTPEKPPEPPKPIKAQTINENFTLEVKESTTTDDSNS